MRVYTGPARYILKPNVTNLSEAYIYKLNYIYLILVLIFYFLFNNDSFL
jgi:hypothetical protein